MLCRRFQRNEIGEVVLPKKERTALRQSFISYIERLVVDPSDIIALATRVSELHLSEGNMWEVLRRQLDHLEEHPLHTAFREHLHTMFSRCAPKDASRIDSMVLCMYEDGLSHEEVVQTIMYKYGVDEAGWPTEPMRRRRVQLTMLLQRHDPEKVPLIESLFMGMPAVSDKDDRLYRTMCETYGADELGRPVARRLSATSYHQDPVDEDTGAFRISVPGSNGGGGYEPLSGVSPVRTGSAPASSATSSRGVSPADHNSKLGGQSFTTSLSTPFGGGAPVTIGGTSPVGGEPHQVGGEGVNPPTHEKGRANRRFQDAPSSSTPHQRSHSFARMPSSLSVPRRPVFSTPHQQRSHSFARMPSSLTPKAQQQQSKQPQMQQQQQPGGGITSSSSFYGPLRDLRARDHWDGNAAAADVAAIIGEQFLKELRDKYGGPDEPRVGANGERLNDTSVSAPAQPLPQEPLRPVYNFEYKSMKPSPLEAHVANPFEAMRSTARSTIEQIQSDAHAAEVRRRKWGDQKQNQPSSRNLPSAATTTSTGAATAPSSRTTAVADPSLFSYLTQTQLPPVDPEMYLPSDETRNLRRRNVAMGVKGAALGGIPWLSDG
ncbi:Hypothetical protein, putative, partial [Bodo saltans]